MRLLTHNLMACVKCQTFPLTIEPTEVVPTHSEYDPEFVRRMLPRIEYSTLLEAFEAVKAKNPALGAATLAPTVEEIDISNDMSPSMINAYLALTGLAVKNGTLRCPTCTTKYPVVDFIPNMMVEHQ